MSEQPDEQDMRSSPTKRREEPLTRGDVLDAIWQAMRARGGNCADHDHADMALLEALHEAFK